MLIYDSRSAEVPSITRFGLYGRGREGGDGGQEGGRGRDDCYTYYNRYVQ